MSPYTRPHADDLPVRRLLARIKAHAAFDHGAPTEDVLARYLAEVTA